MAINIRKNSFAIVVLVSVLNIFLFAKSINAEDVMKNYSWTDDYPSIFSSNMVSTVPDSFCRDSFSLKEVSGENGLQKVCLFDGGPVSFGYYYPDTTIQGVVSFSNDSKLYKVFGACGRYSDCIYSPSQDALITKQYLINGIVRSLVIYKNFSNRLTRRLNSANLAYEYDFDSSNPDYIFKSSDGYAWPIGGISMSKNGQWLAVEFRERGFGLLNIETLEMKRISNLAFRYGVGRDPTTELAVSNDGEAVAIMGFNSGIGVIEVNDSCGDEADDGAMWSVSPLDYPCKTMPVNYEDIIPRLFYATHPSFTEDGYGLDFFASSFLGETREISLRASNYSVKKLDYLALGDSFTSGEGEFDDKYYLDKTNEEYEKCHVSSRSYPFLLADLSNINPEYMRSVACSGARTIDVVGDYYTYDGQNDRLISDYINTDDIILLKNQARINFVQGRILQSNFVQNNRPSVVTIGIGGNDIGMIDKLKACLGPGTCDWVSDSEKRQQFAEEIKNLFPTLVDTYQKLHDLSPNSKIYAINYPRPTDINGQCDTLTNFLINADERELLTEAVLLVNQIIKAAAEKVGIGYMDIQESYGAQVLCGDKKPYAINSLMLGDDIGISWFKFVGNESFHPNPIGHQLSANYVFSNIGAINTYEYCEDGSKICPKDIAIPEASSYWLYQTDKSLPKLKLGNFVKQILVKKGESKLVIGVDAYSFMPKSTVQIELHSSPIKLGEYTVLEDGSLAVDITVPSTVVDGFHTIFIKGLSFSGETIDLYQIVSYKNYVDEPTLQNNTNQENVDTKTEQNNHNNTKIDEIVVSKQSQSEKIKINPSANRYEQVRETTSVLGEMTTKDNYGQNIDQTISGNNDSAEKLVDKKDNIRAILIGLLLVAIIYVVVFLIKKNKN